MSVCRMISQIFILSSKGDHLIYKDCILGSFIIVGLWMWPTVTPNHMKCCFFKVKIKVIAELARFLILTFWFLIDR